MQECLSTCFGKSVRCATVFTSAPFVDFYQGSCVRLLHKIRRLDKWSPSNASFVVRHELLRRLLDARLSVSIRSSVPFNPWARTDSDTPICAVSQRSDILSEMEMTFVAAEIAELSGLAIPQIEQGISREGTRLNYRS